VVMGTEDIVGRLSTSGTFSLFPLPIGSANPGAMAPGPDGNVWFVDDLNNTIDRVTPTGAFAMFVIPTTTANPTAITAGPERLSAAWPPARVANTARRGSP
jgi:virginiamycin B lyase